MFKYNFILILITLFAFSFQGSKFSGDDDIKLLFEKSLPTEKGQKLRVDTQAGNIKITSWDKNEVQVKIYGSAEIENSFEFEVGTDASGVKVNGSKKAGARDPNNITVKYEISVPLDYSVKVSTGVGNVTLTDQNGTVEISTKGGNVSLGNVTGDIDVSTAGGNIIVSKNKGMLKLSTAGGNIKAKNFSGNVDASTAGGSINLTGSNGKVEGSTAGGSISLDYTGKNYGIDLSTMAGQISVDLPPDFDADADLSTMVGKVKCDFYTSGEKNKSSNLQTKINNGGEPLRCSTMAGNINISKK